MKSGLLIILLVATISGCRNMREQRIENLNDSSSGSEIILIGTYTEEEAHVTGKARGIYMYKMESETGKLVYVTTSPFTINPSFLDISNDGRFVYAVNETGGDKPGQVSAFRISGGFSGLEYINSIPSGGDYPCYIETSHNGKFILVANYGSGTVALAGINEDGSLKQDLMVDRHTGKGPTSRQRSPHAHCIMSSPDGNFAYSNDLGTDEIIIYKTAGSELKYAGRFKAAPGSGPRHLAFHPLKPIVYSINELNGTIDCMHRDTITGSLELFQTIPTVYNGKGNEAGSADIHITPAGHFLYATNRGNFDNISAFRIDSNTGELTLIGLQSVKGKTPRNFAIDPSGRFLLVANQNSDQVVVFRINNSSGILEDTGIEESIPTPVCIKFFPGSVKN